MAEVHQRPGADEILARIRAEEEKSKRGKLKVFLGYAAGVGKTYAMLQEAHQRKSEGIDVTIAYVDTHGRTETELLLTGLEIIPRRQLEYRGIKLTEMDIDAVLKRHPKLALVDELAHTNAQKSRHQKRYQDVEELLAAGIDIYTTLNIQHISSLQSLVAQITSVWIREIIPDSFIEQATEIKVIDLPPDDLLERLNQGKVYLPEQVRSAVDNFFRKNNLTALRELTMRTAAEHVDEQMQTYMKEHAISGTWATMDRILVCVSPSRSSSRLVRLTRRLSRQLNAEWFAVYVETPEVSLTEEEQEYLTDSLRQAEQLGGEVLTVQGDSVAATITKFATDNKINRIVIGKPDRTRLQKLLLRPTLAEQLINMRTGHDIYVISDEPAFPVAGKTKTEFNMRWEAYLWAMIPLVLASLVNAGLRPHVSPTNLAMIYLLSVAVTAFYFGLGPAILVSLLSVLVFDFFFVPPYFTFRVSDIEYLLTFAALLIISLIISYLGWRIRRQSTSALRREKETATMYDLSRKLTAMSDMDTTVRTITTNVKQLVKTDVTIFLPQGNENTALKPYTEEGGPSIDENESAVAVWVFEHGQSAGYDTDTLPSARALHIPLKTTRGIVGVMSIWLSTTDLKLTHERRRLLDSLTGLAALAIERVQLVKTTYDFQVRETVEKLQSSLINSVSHDLHTPLASIIGALETLQDKGISMDAETMASMIELARQEAERLNRLVSNLLDISRIESGALKLFYQPSDIREVVDAAMEQARLINSTGRPVNIDIPDGMPLVPLDFGLMVQALKNIMENADKYSAAGLPIDVKVRQLEQNIEIEISDRGIGISIQDLARVFDKFYRVQRPGNIGGIGLGLSICKGIIEAHRGRIVAEQREGGGVTIRMTVPLIVPEQAAR